MQTYCGYFGHAWLHSPKMIIFNVYLHAKNKLHNSFHSYNITFQRILQIDWLAAFWPITWDPKFCQICWWNINNNFNFHYRLFPRKNNITKFFKEIPKTLFWAHFGLFCPNWGQEWIFQEKRPLSVFQYSNYLPLCQNQKNLMSHSWKNRWRVTPKTSLFH